MEVLVLGVAMAFNILVILKKIRMERYEDAGLDAMFLFGLGYAFGGTLGGMAIATVASAVISVYLYTAPDTFSQFFTDDDDDEDDEEEIAASTPTEPAKSYHAFKMV